MCQENLKGKVIHRNTVYSTGESIEKQEYHGGFKDVAVAGSWREARNILGEEPGFVSTEKRGEIEEGCYKVVSEKPDVPGVFIDSDLFENEEVERDSRCPGGFFFRNSDGNPVELKYRFSDELRNYPETVHMHNVPELYVADGKFNMDVADETKGLEPTSFTNIQIENESFVVPAGLYHGITSRENESNLMVARGDPKLQQEYVGKWDIDGEQLYNHFNKVLEKPQPTVYEERNDEMYRLW